MTQLTLKERLAWHAAPEHRSWKRKLQVAELLFLLAMVFTAIAAVVTAPGEPRLASTFCLFAGCLATVMIALLPFFLRDASAPRYVRGLVILGLGAGAGGLAGFGLLLYMSVATSTGNG